MISYSELTAISTERIKDAEILLHGQRYDGAVYLCGYAVELWLKAKICQTLNWAEYPETNHEFKNYQSFRTHDLEVLLHLSGIENIVRSKKYKVEWSIVKNWNPNMRYSPRNQVNYSDTNEMIKSAKVLVAIQ